MTTLPQTTTLRLPRPSAPAQLNLPGPMSPAPMLAGGGAGGNTMSGADVWRVLRANM